MFKRHASAALFAASAAFAPASHAAVELSASPSSQFAIFNFDLTPFPLGYTPISMFVAANTGPTYNPNAPDNDAIRIELYKALNGGGGLVKSCDFFTCGVASSDTDYLDILDGVFSVKFTALSGSFTVNPFAEFTDGGDEISSNPTLTGKLYRTDGVVIPLPGTLALLALGTVAIGFVGSRRHRVRQAGGRWKRVRNSKHRSRAGGPRAPLELSPSLC